jgi:hypothetical protein
VVSKAFATMKYCASILRLLVLLQQGTEAKVSSYEEQVVAQHKQSILFVVANSCWLQACDSQLFCLQLLNLTSWIWPNAAMIYISVDCFLAADPTLHLINVDSGTYNCVPITTANQKAL